MCSISCANVSKFRERVLENVLTNGRGVEMDVNTLFAFPLKYFIQMVNLFSTTEHFIKLMSCFFMAASQL